MAKKKFQVECLFPGFKIRDLNDLALAVTLRKAIVTKDRPQVGSNHQGYRPAAFIFNMNASVVHRWIVDGMYIHKTKNEPKLWAPPS